MTFTVKFALFETMKHSFKYKECEDDGELKSSGVKLGTIYLNKDGKKVPSRFVTVTVKDSN